MASAALHPTALTGGGVLLRGISWQTYEILLDELERSGCHRWLTYDKGDLEIFAPTLKHERSKHLVGRLVETVTEELDIPIRSGGSPTFCRRSLGLGLEPHECDWIERELLVRGRRTLDLHVDSVPDLAIEVEMGRKVLDRLPIYAALGFAEIWRYDGVNLRVVRFRPEGTHVEQVRSEVFPFLPVAELVRFLEQAKGIDETTWIRGFRAWVREEIVPRREGGGRPA